MSDCKQMMWFFLGIGVGIYLEQSYHFPKIQPWVKRLQEWEKENKKKIYKQADVNRNAAVVGMEHLHPCHCGDWHLCLYRKNDQRPILF